MSPRSVESFNQFKDELKSDTNLQDKFKADPVATINEFQQQSPLTTDKWIYRIIVLALGFTILSIIVGVIVLIGTGQISTDAEVPTILTAIGSAAIGALAGLLAPPPPKNN